MTKVKARNIFGALLATSLLLLGACSEETVVDMKDTPAEGAEGVVRVKLITAGTATRAEGDAATDEEKAVKSIYVVAFKDIDQTEAVTTTETGSEADDDVLIKAELIKSDAFTGDNSNEFTFKLGTGNYQICFIGNPSEDMQTKIAGLKAGTSTVKEFKALTEDLDPADKTNGMLMTSDFTKCTVKADGLSLSNVTLVRAMARVDIINKADGITITKATLNNRAVKTVLISDNSESTATDYLATTTDYTLNLAGKSDGSAGCEAEIYSYEQYNTSGSVVSMTLEYTIDGMDKTYQHTVEFKTTTGTDAAATQIPMKRNYLYTINVGNNQGKVTFNLTVTDWEEGTTFEVTSDELLAWTIDYSGIRVGDIMLNDGTYVDMSSVSELTEDQRAKAIGVVAYVGSHFKSGVKSAISNPHGLVLALKDAVNGNGLLYMSLDGKTTGVTLGTDNQSTSIKALYETVMDGYAAYTKAMATTAQHSRIFEQATTYNTNNKTPENTTGWYIPSIGEWIDIFGSEGIGKSSNVSNLKTNTGNDKSVSDAATITSNINTALAKVGGSGYYGTFKSGFEYWSSSERDANYAYIVYKNTGTNLIIADPWEKTNSVHSGLRCILAF